MASGIASRILADELGQQLGGTAFVENREGAGGVIGAQAATRSAPNGYTLLVAGNSLMTSQKSLYKNLPYDPLKDLDPVARLSGDSHIIVVKISSLYKDWKDLVKAAGAKPGSITYCSGGSGTSVPLTADVPGAVGPETGACPLSRHVAGGHRPNGWRHRSDVRHDGLGSLAHQGGPVAFARHHLAEPGCPAARCTPVAEQGLPKYEVQFWLGLYAPKGPPPMCCSAWNKLRKNSRRRGGQEQTRRAGHDVVYRHGRRCIETDRVLVRTAAGLFKQGEPGFCDALVSLIGQKAPSVTSDVASALTLAFTDEKTVVVLVDAGSIRGPEAWQVNTPAGEFVVEQNYRPASGFDGHCRAEAL